MTDKQCEFFCKNGCYIYAMTCDYNNICKQNEECFVKKILSKLKDKEQECERLKKVNDEKNELLANLGCPTIETARRLSLLLKEQLNQLKAENEELKEKINYFACSENCYKYKQADQLKQALQEIHKIANFTLWNYPTISDVDVYKNLEKILRIAEDEVEK